MYATPYYTTRCRQHTNTILNCMCNAYYLYVPTRKNKNTITIATETAIILINNQSELKRNKTKHVDRPTNQPTNRSIDPPLPLSFLSLCSSFLLYSLSHSISLLLYSISPGSLLRPSLSFVFLSLSHKRALSVQYR